jgi:hypothetical protein
MAMKTRIFFLLLCLMWSPALAQYRDSAGYYCIQATVGYTTYALSDVHDFYDEVLDMYDELGVRIPTQKSYPGNAVFGVSVTRNIPSLFRVGLETQYSQTKAYSGYEDYAGTLEVNAKVTMTTIAGLIERDLFRQNQTALFAGLKGGLLFVRSRYTNTISFTEYPGEVGEVRLTGHGDGYLLEGYLGVSRTLHRWVGGLTLGYRLSKADHLQGKMTIPGEGSYCGKLELEHDVSGIIANLRIGYRLGR